MANSTHPVPAILGNGAGAIKLRALKSNQSPHGWCPPVWWTFPITAAEILEHGTHTVTITVPAAGLVDGEISARFLGTDAGGTAVDVTITALFDTDEDGTAAALEAAIETARATTLADVVSTESVTDNVITVVMLAAASVAVTVDYTPAQTADAVWSGTLQDGVAYIITIDGFPTQVVRAGGSPADAAAMAVAMEAALEANANLSGILISADDDTVDTNALVLEPGIDTATITASYVGRAQTFTAQFGGTIVNGDYVLHFVHPDLPNIDGDNQVDVTVTRAAGTPADEAALAVAMEAAIEANPHLAALIASADDDSVDTNVITTLDDVTGLEITATDPGTATLTVTETTPEITITSTTPAGPTLTATASYAVDLNVAFPNNAVWSEIDRGWAGLYRISAFDTGVTADLGDAGDPDAVLSAVALDGTGWISDTGNAQSNDFNEPAWAPVLTVNFGEADTDTGEVEVWVVVRKHQTGAW